MNYLMLIAAVLAVFATVGHFVIGTKEYLKPIMTAEIDEIPKRIMQSLFHYMSVFMILSSFALLAMATGDRLIFDSPGDVLKIIGLNYAGFAIVQFIIASRSKVKNGVFKMFQWIFWALIAFFSFTCVF